MYYHCCVSFCKGQGPHLHEAFFILPKRQQEWCYMFFGSFLMSTYPRCTSQWKHWFVFQSQGRLEPKYIPTTQLSYGTMKIMNPGHGECTGCDCASRASVQVASLLSRGAKGQETCGAKGAEEKVVSPDSVFLMTCISKRKARGYRK